VKKWGRNYVTFNDLNEAVLQHFFVSCISSNFRAQTRVGLCLMKSNNDDARAAARLEDILTGNGIKIFVRGCEGLVKKNNALEAFPTMAEPRSLDYGAVILR